MGSRSRTVGPNAKIWVSNEFLGCPESPHQVSAKSVTGRKHPPWLSQKTTLKFEKPCYLELGREGKVAKIGLGMCTVQGSRRVEEAMAISA